MELWLVFYKNWWKATIDLHKLYCQMYGIKPWLDEECLSE
jgi:hypothetical protein